MMVRQRISRSPRPANKREHKSPNRSLYTRRRQYKPGQSPILGSKSGGKSPNQQYSSVHNFKEERRPHFKRDNNRGGNTRGDSNGRFKSNNLMYLQRNNKKRKWNKKKRNIPPMSGGNRQPISSMRMRMDDYIPRSGRALLTSKSNDIENAVARARREASTRTKDTFWTKKLLDAETCHPTRWAHNGFKELYREELGYSGTDYRSGEENLTKNYSRDNRRSKSAKDARATSQRRKFSPSHQRSHRRHSPTEAVTERGKSSRTVMRGRRILSHEKTGGHKIAHTSTKQSNKKSLHPKRKSHSSFSRSNSRLSSNSDSRSRSYSSYSRSSYSSRSTSSASSSSSFSSSSGSSRSYSKKSRRSYSRSSKSWSRSTSPSKRSKYKSSEKLVKTVKPKTVYVRNIAPVPKIKKTNRLLQSSSKNKSKTLQSSLSFHQNKAKQKLISPQNDYYDPSIITEDTPPPVIRTTSRINVDTAASSHDLESVPITKDVQRTPIKKVKRLPSEKITPVKPQCINLKRERLSHSESSSDEEDFPAKLTLSERFGKLAQLSSQRQEYDGVRMKIVREGGQDKKVYLEGGTSRSPSPSERRNDEVSHERWLREHQAEYDEYQQRYGEFRQWDPHRDLPTELPRNWEDINVRYRYYKESGYFGDRAITMEDYLKWEQWWYKYRDWFEKYGGAEVEKYRGPSYNGPRTDRMSTRRRWTRQEKRDQKRVRY